MTPTLIVTRPTVQSDSFVAAFAQAWGAPLDVIVAPLLKIVPMPARIGDVDAVIFTSANGVAAAQPLNLPRGKRAWCVGAKTAQAATLAGFETIMGPGDARGLVREIIAARQSGTCAHIRGKHTRGDVATTLQAAGIICQDVVAYDQVALPLSDQARERLRVPKPVIFPLFSPRTGTILGSEGPFVAPAYGVALSDAVKNAVHSAHFMQINVATEPSSAEMVSATVRTMKDVAAQA